MNKSVVVPAKQVIDSPEILKDLARLKPAKVIIFVRSPIGLKAIEIAAKSSIKAVPMLAMFYDTAELLANMAQQCLDVLNTNDLYLMIPHQNSGEDYIQSFLSLIQSRMGHERKLVLHLCASSATFIDRESLTSRIIEAITDNGLYDYVPCATVTDSEASQQFLDNNLFLSWIKKNFYASIIITTISSHGWTARMYDKVEALERDLIYWTIETFLQNVASNDEIPNNVTAIITTIDDRISVWSSMNKDKQSIRKIGKGDTDIWVIETFHLEGDHWGRLYDGGYVNLKHFELNIL